MSEQKADYKTSDVLALDYDSKVKMLENIVRELLQLRVEFAHVSGRFAELRAQITVLKEVKSALQSAIKAEQSLSDGYVKPEPRRRNRPVKFPTYAKETAPKA